MNIDLSIFNNEYLWAIISIIVAIYVAKERMQLPEWIMNLFKNDMFRLVILFLVPFIGTRASPHVALIVALLFIVTFDYVLKQNTKEHFNTIVSRRNSNY